MESPILDSVGGILGLCQFLKEPGIEEALAVDLLRLGRSYHAIGSPALSWFELKCLIKFAPTSSELVKVINPTALLNTPHTVLLSLVVDALNGANWQRGGGKGARPQSVTTALHKWLSKPHNADADMTPAKMADTRVELKRRRQQLKA